MISICLRSSIVEFIYQDEAKQLFGKMVYYFAGSNLYQLRCLYLTLFCLGIETLVIRSWMNIYIYIYIYTCKCVFLNLLPFL